MDAIHSDKISASRHLRFNKRQELPLNQYFSAIHQLVVSLLTALLVLACLAGKLGDPPEHDGGARMAVLRRPRAPFFGLG